MVLFPSVSCPAGFYSLKFIIANYHRISFGGFFILHICEV